MGAVYVILNRRVSYNGYYVTFPRLRRGFDSLHPQRSLEQCFFGYKMIEVTGGRRFRRLDDRDSMLWLSQPLEASIALRNMRFSAFPSGWFSLLGKSSIQAS